jgi:hypothetical protein
MLPTHQALKADLKKEWSMTMSINLQTGGFTPQILPGSRSTDIQVVEKQVEQYPVLVPAPSNDPVQAAEQKRYDNVFSAAQNNYAVADKRFTIFKDSSGQYVTRYTSLRDGTITYVPELKLVEFFGTKKSDVSSVLNLQA